MDAQYDDLFKALADRHRRAIVSTLCRRPVVASDLAQRVGLAPNALSFHLKWLRSAGLISAKRQGRHLWYQLEPGVLDAWRSYVDTCFSGRPAFRVVARAPRTRDRASAPAATAPATPQFETPVAPSHEPAREPVLSGYAAESDSLPAELL
jgi:DNA-binding transcriptional ArsR family regulator